ncbi:WAPL (Wings apart-like protein regulation ofheterochromatin) protein, partial [Striga asiatica]
MPPDTTYIQINHILQSSFSTLNSNFIICGITMGKAEVKPQAQAEEIHKENVQVDIASISDLKTIRPNTYEQQQKSKEHRKLRFATAYNRTGLSRKSHEKVFGLFAFLSDSPTSRWSALRCLPKTLFMAPISVGSGSKTRATSLTFGVDSWVQLVGIPGSVAGLVGVQCQAGCGSSRTGSGLDRTGLAGSGQLASGPDRPRWNWASVAGPRLVAAGPGRTLGWRRCTRAE